MKTIATKKLILIAILLSSTFLFSQTNNEEDEYTIPEIDYFFNGKIILNNQENIAASICLNHQRNKKHFAIINDSTGVRYISNDEISRIILFANKNNCHIESAFEKIDDTEKFYRIVGVGKVTVYDSSVKPFSGNLVSTVFIKKEDKVFSIFDFWSSGPKQDLINYINKRDGKDFRRRDFKSISDLIAYAVD